ncbi:MAG: VWA domain-containing protein [Thermoanaerobaculia bacterium]
MRSLRRTVRRGGLASALLLLGTAPAALAQAAPAAPPSFSDTAQVLSVEVPVQVVRDGEPVRGLEAGDFEVWDGRRKLPVTGFEMLDLSSPSGPAGRTAGVPAAARRHFLLVFDLAFSGPKAVARARQAAIGLLPKLHPTDLVAVATYSASRGPQLVLGFTADRRQIQSAVSSLGLPDFMVRPADPLRLVLEEVLGAGNAATGGPATARDPLAEATDGANGGRFTGVTDAVDRAEKSVQRTRIELFARSLSELARQVSLVEGRKYLVFLSEGFDVEILQGTIDPERREEMREEAVNGESWRVSPEERYGRIETSNAVERMLEEFRRADCTIQAVDIGGVRAGADQGPVRIGGRDSLLVMARGTGGELYESYNDLGDAMGQMLKRTGVTYVLAVQPDRPRDGGEYHRLRVDLAKPLRGARLTHRPGYYPPKPYAEQDPIQKLLDAANLVMSGEEIDDLPAQVLAAPFKAGEKAYVPVIVEIDGPALLAGRQPPTLPVEVYAYALDEFGAVHDFFTQTIGLELTRAAPPLRQGGVKFFGHLDLLPGDYSLRVLVRNAASGASGLKVLPLRVPAFGSGEASLQAFVPEPPNRWLMVREEARDPAQATPPYPFLMRNQPFVPSVRPVLASGRDVRLVLAGAGLGGAPWKARAAVIAADGREVPAGDVEVTDRRPGGEGTPDRAMATVRLPDLKPGEYLLRITLPGPPDAAASLRFVVPPARPRG